MPRPERAHEAQLSHQGRRQLGPHGRLLPAPHPRPPAPDRRRCPSNVPGHGACRKGRGGVQEAEPPQPGEALLQEPAPPPRVEVLGKRARRHTGLRAADVGPAPVRPGPVQRPDGVAIQGQQRVPTPGRRAGRAASPRAQTAAPGGAGVKVDGLGVEVGRHQMLPPPLQGAVGEGGLGIPIYSRDGTVWCGVVWCGVVNSRCMQWWADKQQDRAVSETG